MTGSDTAAVVALIAMGLVALASAVIGALGVRTRNTSDFMLASRSVGTRANASAISGEYLSAASFLGVAGLILRDGVDALWYPVGFTAGYLALTLFVAAPLRRSGAYTVPDFAEARLHSPALRRLCTAVVIVIGWLYVLPQLQGAGLTVATVTPWPSWVGVAAAGALVLATVTLGGMRSITFVQAFQYWLKLTAMVVPAVVVVSVFAGDGHTFDEPAPPEFPDRATVQIRTDVVLQVLEPVTFAATGEVDGAPVDGPLTWTPGLHTVRDGAELVFEAGSPVPVVQGAPAQDASWLTPLPAEREYGLVGTYSLIIALFLGTMGLPHVLVRFYSNPDGRAARRTAVVVLGLVGVFYVMVTALGALARLYTPQLLVSGDTDAAVLLLPTAALGGGWPGVLLGALVAAGAWAAFLSTSSGLIVSIAGVLSTDVLAGRWRDFRIAALIAGVVPLVLALGLSRLDFGEAVALAFAVAASTFCPLLVLGVWWRGLTDRGAVAGVAAGALASIGPVTVSLAGGAGDGLVAVLLDRPAILSVPIAFVVMISVSLFTQRRRPTDTDLVLLRLHAPELLGLTRERPSRSRIDPTS